MTRLLRIVLRSAACAAALAAFSNAFAQTGFTTGAVEVRGFYAASSTVVHAAAYGGGLYRSTNAGVSWTRISLPNNARYLTGISGNTSQIVVVGDEGIFRSTDGGLNYSWILAEPATVVAMPSGASSTVLVGAKGVGILRSTNGGASFTAANNAAIDSLDPTGIAFDPSNANLVYASMMPDGVGNRGGVFRSTDGGATWAVHTAIAGAFNNHVTSVVVDTAGTVYATVFRPNDGGGDTFIQTGGAGAWAAGGFYGALSLHRDTNNGLTIWSGSRYLGLQRRLNGAGPFDYTFNATPDPNLFFTSVNAVTTLPGTTVALKALKGAGVWRTASFTPFSWTRVSFPGADRVLSASGVGGASNILLGLRAGGVWRSTDGTATAFNPPVVNGAVQADFAYYNAATQVNIFTSIWDIGASTTTSIAYVASGGPGMFYGNDNPGVFRYNGTRWQGVGSGLTSTGPYSNLNEPGNLTLPSAQVWGATINRGDDTRAYIGTFGGTGLYYRSGGTWTSPAIPLSIPATRSVVSALNNNERLIALSFDDKPALSTNGGASWAATSASQYGFERVRFFQAAPNPTNANNWIGATNRGILVSNDAGASWTRVSGAGVFFKQAVTSVGFSGSGRAIAADFAGNRYCSSNGGASWVSMGAALRAGVNKIATIAGNVFYLTDGAGMFREDGTC